EPAGTRATTLRAKQMGPEPKVAGIAQPVVDSQPSAANSGVAIAIPGAQQGVTEQTMAQASMRLSPDELHRTVVPQKPALPGADLEAKLSQHIQDYPRD